MIIAEMLKKYPNIFFVCFWSCNFVILYDLKILNGTDGVNAEL